MHVAISYFCFNNCYNIAKSLIVASLCIFSGYINVVVSKDAIHTTLLKPIRRICPSSPRVINAKTQITGLGLMVSIFELFGFRCPN